MGLLGHLWTIAPAARHRVRPSRPPASAPWSTIVPDARLGAVRLTGRLATRGDEPAIAVLVHGLGGSDASPYVVDLARTLHAAGLATLRLNLRGADDAGEDWYHAGLTSDLAATLADDALARFDRIVVAGFSLGGHLALRLATEGPDPRLRAIAAVCPPLDLQRGSRALDAPVRRPYLRYVLSGLLASYARVAARRPVDVPLAEARRIRRIRAWDERIVAPRHGFAGADDYYARTEVGPHLGAITTRTLLLAADDDPMIPIDTVTPWLARASRAVDTRVVRGGHVGFPASLDLGQRAPRGLEPQLAAWLAAGAVR